MNLNMKQGTDKVKAYQETPNSTASCIFIKVVKSSQNIQ